MYAHRLETVLTEDKSLTLNDLPFNTGTAVEVIILERPTPSQNIEASDPYPLRGSVLRYDDPFEPACPPDDWEALR